MTQEAKHTPGPWTLSEECSREGLLSRLVYGPHLMVAIVRTETQAGPIGDANANLIAAAPELLEALEQTIAAVDTLPLAVECPALEQAVDRARAAITKASGA